jgi:hypothetical protein
VGIPKITNQGGSKISGKKRMSVTEEYRYRKSTGRGTQQDNLPKAVGTYQVSRARYSSRDNPAIGGRLRSVGLLNVAQNGFSTQRINSHPKHSGALCPKQSARDFTETRFASQRQSRDSAKLVSSLVPPYPAFLKRIFLAAYRVCPASASALSYRSHVEPL